MIRNEGNRLARGARAPARAILRVAACVSGFLFAAACASAGEPPELSLPRPGAIVVLDLVGEASAIASEQPKSLKPDDRVRVGSIVRTQRLSLMTLILSNGATVRVGSESEVEVEEFGQATIPSGLRFAELKAEPTVSRTQLRLVRGGVTINVKPLNVQRGSTFLLSTPAGVVRTGEGVIHAMVQMSDLGLGVCTVEVQRGAAEFELPGAAFAPVPAGRTLAFALELDKSTGVVKVSAMPKPVAADSAKATAPK
jgi:hypothetical protein